MKILFWMTGSFDRRTPSAHLLTAVIRALCHRGHQVCILQKQTGGQLPLLPEALQGLAVSVQAVPVPNSRKESFTARYLADVKYLLACRKYLCKREAYGAVFLQSCNMAGLALWLLRRALPGVPVTYNVQDIFPDNAGYVGMLSPKGLPYRVLRAVQRYAYRRADHVITISEDMAMQLLSHGVSAQRLHCIYNWSYRDDPYCPEELDMCKVRHLLPEGQFNVVYAGNIGVMQNVELLLEAAAKLRDDPIRFHIIGDGQYQEKLRARAEEQALDNLSFWPMQDSSLAPAIYCCADVNVIPLEQNIYRTALPSKTAVCLACPTPALFCFGGNSLFLEKVARIEPKCCCASVDALCDTIRKLREGYQMGDLRQIYLRDMRMSENADRYARIITGELSGQ